MYGLPMTTRNETPTNIRKAHCQACGSTDTYDLGGADTDGYTRCCNERVIYNGTDVFGNERRCSADDCYHE